MVTKIFEIRDIATYIPVMATKMVSDNKAEEYHLVRSGYGKKQVLVMIVRLAESWCSYSPYDWDIKARTMIVAHKFIKEHFDELETGDVIDVEYILGETETKKLSERIEE